MTINIFVLKGDLNGKIVVVRFFFCRVYVYEIKMGWDIFFILSNWEFLVWNWGKTYFLALGIGPNLVPKPGDRDA